MNSQEDTEELITLLELLLKIDCEFQNRIVFSEDYRDGLVRNSGVYRNYNIIVKGFVRL